MLKTEPLFSVFVNSTDTYKDCWEAFFKLFKKFWPDYKGPIYLNSESLGYSDNELNIVSIKNLGQNLKWSKCLKQGLSYVSEEYILYLQEDYFLRDYVDIISFTEKLKIFIKNDLDCLHLTDQNYVGPFNKKTGIEDVWELMPGNKFRISTQAALWKKSALIDLLRDWENGWQFEKYATLRANKMTLKLMTVSHDKYGIIKREIIPYVFTGIINNMWKKEVVPLFNQNEIYIQYNERGFFEDREPQKIINRLRKRLNNIPQHIRSRIELFFL